MSASSKKKLRNEQEAAKMTERQLTEQKEAKKLKTYTALFVAVLAVIVVVAVIAASVQIITINGLREKHTVALTVGDQEVSNAELNYFYIDAVNEFYSYYGTYASMFGLDVSLPLNEQVVDAEAGTTWADDFLNTAKTNAQSVYALANEAEANGYTLTEEEIATIETNMMNLETYALLYGYTSTVDYVKAMYGMGATVDSYREYVELNTLANSYYNFYTSSLTYDDAELREAEAENSAEYSAYTYNSYYISVSNYLEGGTTDEETGTTTYSDEERAAAVAAAEADAKALVDGNISNVKDLDAAIAELPINADKESAPTSTDYVDVMYSSIGSTIQAWVTDSARQTGDIDYIANESTSTAEDGTETTTVNGYYVVLFTSTNDNFFPLANVRHILVGFEGGSYDSSTGVTTYTDEEKATAKAKAEELLAQWKNGDADVESFDALAKEESTDTGSAANGGLYEDVYPGQMVTNFNDWCFADGRQAGDTGIVESEYGYHIMYYVGDSETTYRDYLVASDLRTAETTEWYNALIEATVVTEQDTSYISKDLVISAS